MTRLWHSIDHTCLTYSLGFVLGQLDSSVSLREVLRILTAFSISDGVSAICTSSTPLYLISELSESSAPVGSNWFSVRDLKRVCLSSFFLSLLRANRSGCSHFHSRVSNSSAIGLWSSPVPQSFRTWHVVRRWVRKGVENARSIVDSAPVLCYVISPCGRRRFKLKELTASTSELALLSAEMYSPPQEG